MSSVTVKRNIKNFTLLSEAFGELTSVSSFGVAPPTGLLFKRMFLKTEGLFHGSKVHQVEIFLHKNRHTQLFRYISNTYRFVKFLVLLTRETGLRVSQTFS